MSEPRPQSSSRTPETAPRQRARSKAEVESGFVVREGSPPPASSGRGSRKCDALSAAVRKLRPGQWLHVSAEKWPKNSVINRVLSANNAAKRDGEKHRFRRRAPLADTEQGIAEGDSIVICYRIDNDGLDEPKE